MRKIVIPIALLSVAVNLILGGFLMSHYYSIRPTIKRAYKEIWFKPSREEIRALEGIVSLVDSIGFELWSRVVYDISGGDLLHTIDKLHTFDNFSQQLISIELPPPILSAAA